MEKVKDSITLNNRVALVSGAGGGIGSAIVNTLLKYGSTVVGFGKGDAAVNNDADYCKCDVTDIYACESFFNYVIKKYGRIDVLVNCAGITNDAMTQKMSEQQFDEVIDVNLKGVWNITRFVGPYMQKSKSGSIINISSVVGVFGNIGQANYAASKGGIIAMTKTWAKEFALKGGNVRVNAVAPGYTKTNMLKTVPPELIEKFTSQIMLRRLAEPQEIANVVLFLASDLSTYITGTTIQVDGGMRL